MESVEKTTQDSKFVLQTGFFQLVSFLSKCPMWWWKCGERWGGEEFSPRTPFFSSFSTLPSISQLNLASSCKAHVEFNKPALWTFSWRLTWFYNYFHWNRFIATKESYANDYYKQQLLHYAENETDRTDLYGRLTWRAFVRCLNTPFHKKWRNAPDDVQNDETQPIIGYSTIYWKVSHS